MTVGELMARLREVPEDTPLCIAEVDEAFGTDVADIEVVDAKANRPDAADVEAIELANGKDKVVVIRW